MRDRPLSSLDKAETFHTRCDGQSVSECAGATGDACSEWLPVDTSGYLNDRWMVKAWGQQAF